MSSHQSHNRLGDNAGRDEALSFAPEWLTVSLDLWGRRNSTTEEKDLASKENFVSRVKVEVRHQESDRVLNTLPGGLAQQLQRALPGSVPGGTSKYFNSFAPRLKERIEESTRPEILSNALASSLISNKTKQAEDLPKRYFNSFLSRVHDRIVDDEEIPAWMESVLGEQQKPVLANRRFFASQRESILDRSISFRQPRHLALLKSSRFRYTSVAASAACLAIFSVLFNMEQTPVEVRSLSSLHLNYGIESVESAIDFQENLVGSDFTLQVIRTEIIEDNADKLDNELVEPPSVLISDDPEAILIQ